MDTLANSSTHATTHENYRKGFPVTDHDHDRDDGDENADEQDEDEHDYALK